jgi:hypothetical protein
LGRGIALRLQDEGHDARVFDEFASRPDVEFLPIIGERQWILVTKDKNVRRNQLEVEAILNSDVRAFVVTAANLNHEQIAQLVLKAMPKITRISRRQGPFVYNITASGIVSQIPHRTLRRRARPRGGDD